MNRSASPFICAVVLLLFVADLKAQVSPEEHAEHHPGQSAGGTNSSMPGGMGEMMKNMGVPPRKELYSTLMSVPELTPKQRQNVEAQAAERMREGTRLIGQALEHLTTAAQSENYAKMQEATALLREGVAQFDSGVAARRAMAEGRAPSDVALAWFKREMNLTSPIIANERRTIQGLSLFHLITMVLLVAFAFAMLAMYFFKMRRAANLFRRIESDGGSPPPGSAPPLT